MIDAFDNTVFVDRPFGDITGANAVQQCHNAGGIAILNHPFGPTSWVSFDWTSLDFDGIELYNGGAGFDASDEVALLRWEESLKIWTPLVSDWGIRLSSMEHRTPWNITRLPTWLATHMACASARRPTNRRTSQGTSHSW